jgi:hypothetical protein
MLRAVVRQHTGTLPSSANGVSFNDYRWSQQESEPDAFLFFGLTQ